MVTTEGPSRGAASLGDEDTASAARAAPRKKQRVAAEIAATRAAECKKRRAVRQAQAPAAAPSSAIDGGYRKFEKIGSGVYGVVYRARDRRTGEIVAMKCLRLDDRRGDCLDAAFAREVSALEKCRGLPSVVQLRASGRRDATTGEAFIVMEFVETTLWDVMTDGQGGGKRHTELEVRRLMRQLLTGAASMHRLGLMHRDIKPDNVLVDGRGNLKICDLGMSRSTAVAPPYSNPVVARRYRAPELLLGSTNYDERIDTWAIGCIMAQLLAGEHPFGESFDEDEQLSNVLGVLGTEDIKSWRGYDGLLPWGCGPSSNLRKLFPCPAEAPIADRPALSEAGFAVLSGLLRCNPDRRMKAARALEHRWFEEE